jgi:hypothetical protein
MSSRISGPWNYWSLTGKRRQLATRQYRVFLVLASLTIVGILLISLSNQQSAAWYAGVAIIVISIMISAARSVFVVRTNQSGPQLLRREYKDAKARSAQNTQEIEQFIAEQQKKAGNDGR